MLPWAWNFGMKNGAGASSVYDPVGNIDPHGTGKQSDPTGTTFV